MSNWIRKLQKRKGNKDRKGKGTRGQKKGPACIRPPALSLKPKEEKADAG